MTLFIAVAVFIGVAALVGGVSLIFRGTSEDAVADRLDALARNNPGHAVRSGSPDDSSVLSSPLDDMPGFLESAFSRITNVRLLIEQADVSMQPTTFVVITLVLAVAGTGVSVVAGLPYFAPLVGLALAPLPLCWLLFKRKRRRSAFGKQMPEALELIARALRAGHSLGAGFQLVGSEMSEPIGPEFTRVFEEQNLGVPLDEALDAFTERMPNLDLRFFATAVILQRQTGGDLAEILDKIGHLVRERFKIFGQIQALTGEGRLSGIVLLALPPGLFLIMLQLNYDYVMILFEDPVGKKLLAGALVLQLLGALVIKKIVNIKV